MAKNSIRYCVVDAFTESAFKGNPAAVCLLEEERDEEWLQAVAREFNTPITCYLTRVPESKTESPDGSAPKFRLRWFTLVAEVRMCGHGTLAASHFLFAYDLVKSSKIEFLTLSGVLMATRVSDTKLSDSSNSQSRNSYLIELDFPVIPVKEYDGADISTICRSLNIAYTNEIHMTTTVDYLLVVLPSGKAVVEVEPDFNEMKKCPGQGIVVTGLAPIGSGFDFFSRFFGPKHRVNEDHVCGSAHCALAPYWSKKLGKHDLVAYQASPRSGVLILHFDEKNQKVLLRGKAVEVMEGSLLV